VIDERFMTALGASALAALVTTIGIFVIRRFEGWARDNITYFMAFAAGVLVAVSLVHMVPEAIAMSAHAPTFVLAGYLALYGLNRFVAAHVCDKQGDVDYALGVVPLIGIGFHSFVDGVVYSISFSVSLATGALVAIGMVLHEFPEGIVTYILLVRSGFSPRKAFALAFAAAAVTTPIGTLASYPLVSAIDRSVLGALLALSAGALIFVGATHLLPRAEAEHHRFSMVALAAGVLVAIGVGLSRG
jgi:zinc and cadmium transporter